MKASQREKASAQNTTIETMPSARGDDKPVRQGTINKLAVPKSKIKVAPPKERKRIFVSGVNSLVGHALFEQMRNDHFALRNGKKSHKFSGTMIMRDATIVPSPNDQIKILDSQRKPKTFGKTIIGADCVIVDLVSGTDLDEAEKIIQILRQPLHEHQTKK